jgi:acyl-CoA thioesterase FadM
MAELKKFTIEERVRWGDVDAARIIFYGAYIRFFEFAETELFRSVGLSFLTSQTSGCRECISSVTFIRPRAWMICWR